MRKEKVRMLTTHVDLHGDKFAFEGLEPMAEAFNKNYLPLTVEHDVRIPPIGRISSAEIVPLEDGEYAVDGTVEIFEKADTLASLAGDGRTLAIPHDDIPSFVVGYDRSYETKEGQQLLTALKALSPASRSTEFAKKAFEPISTLVIGAGIFAFGAIAGGFFSRLGEDLYEGLKKVLASYFARTGQSAHRIIDFCFTVDHREHFIEVHILVENPTPELLESLFSSHFAGIDDCISNFDQDDWAVARVVLKYQDGRLNLLYILRRDCVPLIPR
jgi:hypothetical protein